MQFQYYADDTWFYAALSPDDHVTAQRNQTTGCGQTFGNYVDN